MLEKSQDLDEKLKWFGHIREPRCASFISVMVVGPEDGGTIEVIAPPIAEAAVARVAQVVTQSQALGAAVWAEESSLEKERNGVTTPDRLRRDSDVRTMMVSLICLPIGYN